MSLVVPFYRTTTAMPKKRMNYSKITVRTLTGCKHCVLEYQTACVRKRKGNVPTPSYKQKETNITLSAPIKSKYRKVNITKYLPSDLVESPQASIDQASTQLSQLAPFTVK